MDQVALTPDVTDQPPPRTEVHAPAVGSVLEVARGGVPGGRPVVLHHGLVGGAMIRDDWHEWAVQVGVELIVPARPGYGRSDPADMGTVSTWGSLMLAVLQRLGHDDDVATLGVSAGAPYALALAAALPDRVTRVAVLSGVAHVPDPAVLAHYDEAARRAYATYDVAPLGDIATGMAAALGPLVDEVGGDDPAWAAALDATLAHGGLGPAREARLQIRPWGFDLDDVRRPVRWWHARDDDQVPFAAAEATVAALPHGTLRVIEAGGHIPSPEVESEARAWLVDT